MRPHLMLCARLVLPEMQVEQRRGRLGPLEESADSAK
jgi:hypothetical protein